MNVPARVAEGPAVRSAGEWREDERAPAFVSLGPAPAESAAWDAELDLGDGLVFRLWKRICRRMFPRAASGCRRARPTCASSSTAWPRWCATSSAGTRLGQPVRLRRPPPHDDEDNRLRAGRLLNPGRRLEQGLFAAAFGPRGESVPLSRTDLQALLDGVDFAAVRRRKRNGRPSVTGPGNISGIR